MRVRCEFAGRLFVVVAIAALLFSVQPAWALTFRLAGELGNGPGTAPGHFNQPTDIQVADFDRDGLPDVVFVADTGNNRVQMFSNDPVNPWTVIAPAGTAPGQVSAPQGIAYDEFNDILYVADTGNSRIQVLPAGVTVPAGPPPAIIAGPGNALGEVNAPTRLAYDEFNDILYVSDTGNNRLQGAKSEDDGVVQTFTWTQIGGPGTAPGEFNAPQGIAYDEFNDILYVSDTGNNRIQSIRINGESGGVEGFRIIATQGSGSGEVNSPLDLAYDEFNDILYVADTSNNRVQAATGSVDNGGNINWEFQGENVVTGLLGPEGLSSTSIKLYVADTGNNRILIFDVVPEPSSAMLAVLAGAGLFLRRRRWVVRLGQDMEGQDSA